LETIPDYNATNPLFLRFASSLVIGVAAVAGQVWATDFPRQGIDLIESFFTAALLSQFIHLGWTHLFLNLAGLALLVWGFSGHCNAREWMGTQLVSLFWVPFYLAVAEPLDWYCGLSGALHFQFASCLLLALHRTPFNWRACWPLWVMGAGLIVKLVLEWNTGHATDELVGGPIAFQAHRGGAIGGLLMGLAIIGLTRPAPRHPQA
jgi:hypothetical protein